MSDTIFTEENIAKLKATCEKIISLCDDSCNGNLMTVQMICLADNIKDFVHNPIVENSGIK